MSSAERRGKPRFILCTRRQKGETMIFIGGIQPRTRLVDKIPRTCPSCGLVRGYLKRTSHYISLFFIPLIPISRGHSFLSCEACGGVFDERGQEVTTSTTRQRKSCAGCGKSVNPSFSYCPYCGRPL